MKQLGPEATQGRRGEVDRQATPPRILAQAVKSAANFRPPAAQFGDPDNMPAQVARVLGPYKNGKTWRVILVEGERKTNKVFRTQEEAQAVVEKLSASLLSAGGIQIQTAIVEFLDHKRREGVRAVTLKAWASRLNSLPQDETLSAITSQRAQTLYEAWVENLAVATQRFRLRTMRAFFAWAVERGYLTTNSFSRIKPMGKPRIGKPQLRVDEAKVLMGQLLQEAEKGDEPCLGLLLQLMMALRSGEVIQLRARDVDNAGAFLCVAMGEEGGKTANAGRTLQVDDPRLQGLLLRQRRGRLPTAPLFSLTYTQQLARALRRICDELKIARIVPHSLRGLCATLNVSRGATAATVASALGHGSEAITRRHYIAPGSIEAAGIRRVATLLGNTQPEPPQRAPTAVVATFPEPLPAHVTEMIRTLSPGQLARLIATIAEDH